MADSNYYISISLSQQSFVFGSNTIAILKQTISCNKHISFNRSPCFLQSKLYVFYNLLVTDNCCNCFNTVFRSIWAFADDRICLLAIWTIRCTSECLPPVVCIALSCLEKDLTLLQLNPDQPLYCQIMLITLHRKTTLKMKVHVYIMCHFYF